MTGNYRHTSSVLSMLEHGKMDLMYRMFNHLVELSAVTFLQPSAHLEQDDITTGILCQTAV